LIIPKIKDLFPPFEKGFIRNVERGKISLQLYDKEHCLMLEED